MTLKGSKAALLDQLTSEDWRVRHDSIEQLGQFDDQELARALLEVVRQNSADLSKISGALTALEHSGRSLTPILIQLLHDPDQDLRLFIPIILGEMKDPEIIPALIGVIDDPQQPENVRFNAFEALSKQPIAEAAPPVKDALVEILRKRLQTESTYLRYAIVLAMGATSILALEPDLLALLDDPYLSEPAIISLGHLAESPNAVKNIVRLLDSEHMTEQVGVNAITAIVMIAQRNANPKEIQQAFVQGCGEQACTWILDQAASTHGPDSTAPYWDHLAQVIGWLVAGNPADLEIRAALAQLFQYPPARPIVHSIFSQYPFPVPNELVGFTNVEDDETICSVMDVFNTLAVKVHENPENPQATEAANLLLNTFMQGLAADDETIVTRSIEGLSSLDNSFIHALQMDALIDRLDDASSGIRQAAISALLSIQAHNPAQRERVLNWVHDHLNSHNASAKDAALRLIAFIRPEEAVQAVFQAMADPVITIRLAAVELLPNFSDPQVISALGQALSDPAELIRSGAARACGLLTVDQAMPLLYRAVQDGNPWVRMYAIRSLGAMAQPESQTVLAYYLYDPFPPVRLAAIGALQRCCNAVALAHYLQPLLDDADAEVRQAAKDSIAGKDSG